MRRVLGAIALAIPVVVFTQVPADSVSPRAKQLHDRAIAARVGGAPMFVGAARVTIWGMLAMLATAAVGRLFGTAV